MVDWPNYTGRSLIRTSSEIIIICIIFKSREDLNELEFISIIKEVREFGKTFFHYQHILSRFSMILGLYFPEFFLEKKLWLVVTESFLWKCMGRCLWIVFQTLLLEHSHLVKQPDI